MPELEAQTGEMEVTLEDVNADATPADTKADDGKAADTKTEDSKAADTKDTTAPEPKKEDAKTDVAGKGLKENVAKAAESNEDAYALLDGVTAEGVVIAPETLKSFKELAKANNLSPEAAKSIVELQVNAAKKQADDFKALQASWEAQNKSTYGDNLKNVETNCSRVLAELDKDGKFKELLALAGAEKHPATLGFLKTIGERILEQASVNPNETVSTNDEEVDLENFN